MTGGPLAGCVAVGGLLVSGDIVGAGCEGVAAGVVVGLARGTPVSGISLLAVGASGRLIEAGDGCVSAVAGTPGGEPGGGALVATFSLETGLELAGITGAGEGLVRRGTPVPALGVGGLTGLATRGGLAPAFGSFEAGFGLIAGRLVVVVGVFLDD